jgi:hypothetical protein
MHKDGVGGVAGKKIIYESSVHKFIIFSKNTSAI